MTRVVMFDLGLTLLDEHDRPFPFVKEALTALKSFVVGGKPLSMCLVSDFKMPEAPPTPAKIKVLFQEYLQILEPTGLLSFFKPVQKRVTLSTHAGALKPAKKVFTTALQRLGATATLNECLFISENAPHVKVAREEHGMQTLLFRAPGATQFDFDDWSEAPLLVAHLIDPEANAETALKAYLSAVRGLEDVSLERTANRNTFKVRARAWSPISGPGLGELEGVLVSLPVEGELTRESQGALKDVRIDQPSPEQLSEATSFVRSLVRTKQIGAPSESAVSRPTHQITVDEHGCRRLVRKRFTAV
jgi:beta-phosphoglucomutase-like phosphatase (HAD superfamily)